MAPSLEEPIAQPVGNNIVVPKKVAGSETPKVDYEPGRTVVEDHDNYDYSHLLPRFPDVKWEPLGEIPYADKGLLGDPEFKNLRSIASDIFDYTPKIGTEVHGVDLTKLTDAQKNDIARLIAIRGVVFFRGQDNFDIESQRELGKYFGTLHKVRTPLRRESFGSWGETIIADNDGTIACDHFCPQTGRTRGCPCCVHW
jgi:sulfonate dioxygenase